MGKRLSFIILTAVLLFSFLPAFAGEEEKTVPPAPESAPSRKHSRFSIIPVPVITADPNEGTTFGAQVNFFFKDGQDRVKAILAPRLTYNSLTKFGGSLAALYYHALDEKLLVAFGMAQEVFRSARVYYENIKAFDDRFYLKGDFQIYQNPFGHFWGLGNQSLKSAESSYVDRSLYTEAEVGYYFLKNLRISLRERLLKAEVRDGIIKNLPHTISVFGPDQGVFDSLDLTHGLALVYDTRPRADLSTSGTLADAYVFFSNTHLGSDNNFHGFVFDVRQLIPTEDARFVSVFRGLFQKVYGKNLPFYQLSDLGGPYELRGFPKNRFIDSTKLLFSFEERIHAANFRFLKTNFNMGFAPFLEVGEVFGPNGNLSFNRLQPVGGLGIRLEVPPSTMFRVDIGWGKEGKVVFVKADYPF